MNKITILLLAATFIVGISISVEAEYDSVNEMKASESTSNASPPAGIPDPSPDAIPDWVDQNFRWYGQGQITQTELLNAMKYLLDNNIMFISEEAAIEVQQLRDENLQLKSKLGEQINEVEVRGWDYEQKEPTSDSESQSKIKVQFPWMRVDFDFTSEIIDDILRKGGTASAWEDGITAFSEHGMSESVVSELEGIVVLCNNEIDKKTQSIEAELKILEQWLEIISERQQSATSDDASSRLADGSTTESNTQYDESELDFISRTLISKDQQIKALDTGIMVLKEKLSSVGDDAQLANIDLQNSLQKQQQTLQTMSNVSKMHHDTVKAIIQNMRS